MIRTSTIILFLASSLSVLAQAPPATPPLTAPLPPPPPPPEGGLTVRDASVGYIDSASPADQIRLRADFGYDFSAPNRAEFFYARGKPLGPGLPLPERSIDFQDYNLYLEKSISTRFSFFSEGGLRFLNPENNANAAGVGDLNLGFKYAFWNEEEALGTFQFRTYIPKGAASRGLGDRHVSLEPAFLGFLRLQESLGLATELRYWQPIGGTEFAGGVMRYGLGLKYDLWEKMGCRFSPTAEAIGWTVLGGKESQLLPDGTVTLKDSSGTTVVNLKLGARIDLGERAGLYAGYGRSLTGDRWYRDVLRVEFRWLY